jgi:hypothetical protein
LYYSLYYKLLITNLYYIFLTRAQIITSLSAAPTVPFILLNYTCLNPTLTTLRLNIILGY